MHIITGMDADSTAANFASAITGALFDADDIDSAATTGPPAAQPSSTDKAGRLPAQPSATDKAGRMTMNKKKKSLSFAQQKQQQQADKDKAEDKKKAEAQICASIATVSASAARVVDGHTAHTSRFAAARAFVEARTSPRVVIDAQMTAGHDECGDQVGRQKVGQRHPELLR